MRYLLLLTFAILIASLNISASATDARTVFSISMEMKEGDLTIAKPRVSVIAGERASIEIDSKVAADGASLSHQQTWKVDALPTLAPTGDVHTSFNVKFSSSVPGGVTQSRSMALETKQDLGKTTVLKFPGTADQPPMSLSVKIDLVTQ